MVDTLSQTPAVAPAQAIASIAASAGPTASGARANLRWIVIGVVALGLLGTGISFVVGWALSKDQLAGVDMFLVAPRTFNVVLKEKGELQAANSTDIICEVEGRSTIISLAEEGAAVATGDLLVELASDKIEDRITQDELKETNAIMAREAAATELDIQRDKNASDIRKGKLEIELKLLDLEKYEKGEWEQTLKDASIAIDEARINLDRREQDFNASKELLTRNFVTQTEYDEEEFKLRKAEWGLEKAKKAMEVLVDYTHVAELRRRQSDLDEAQKECDRIQKTARAEENRKARSLESKTKELAIIQDQLGKLRAQRKKCRITAPNQGFVVYYSRHGHWRDNDSIKEGSEVRERQVLMQLPDTSKMIVALRINESKTDKLHLGQPAMVEVEGLPGRQFSGNVSKIAVIADTQNRWLNPDLREYETEITLDTTEEILKPGVTAHVEILVDAVENALAVPVQAVYSKGGRRYVFRDGHGTVEDVEVQIGPIGTVWVEIVEGLAEGDRVLLAFTDEHRRLIQDQPLLKRNGWSSQQRSRASDSGHAGSHNAEAKGRPHRGKKQGRNQEDKRGSSKHSKTKKKH